MRRTLAQTSLVAAGLAVLLAWPVAAQTPSTETTPSTEAPAAETPATPADPNPVVASVNGKEIRLDEVRGVQQQLPAPYNGYPLQLIFPQLIDILIDRNLVAAEARSQGVDKQEQVIATMARVEEQILERVFMQQYIRDNITEEALRSQYDKTVANESGAEQVRARHILVETEAEAKAIIEEINGGGDFEKLATDRSTGPSSSKGGDLGYFGAEEMVKEFSEAAFALQPGEITKEPVQTQFGWHVIKVEDRRTAEPPSFEESKDQLTAEVSRDIGAALVKELRGKAEVKRFNIDGSESTPEGDEKK